MALPADSFYRRSGGGLYSWCKSCYRQRSRDWNAANRQRRQERRRAKYREDIEANRAATLRANRRHRLKRFGLTPEGYDALLAAQGGACAICGRREPGGPGTWNIDHNHSCCPPRSSCGACVRGLLCARCNSAIGLLGDDPATIRRAARYLEGECT